jgi:RNA polymerase sigma factor (TIGR02999 family)
LVSRATADWTVYGTFFFLIFVDHPLKREFPPHCIIGLKFLVRSAGDFLRNIGDSGKKGIPGGWSAATPHSASTAMPALPNEVTQLLINWSEGDQTALEELIPLVDVELRRLARHYLARENPGHTLQTSALINEAYLRLLDQPHKLWQNRAHFFGVAAQVMRHILIDHARRHCYAKRGGRARKVPLDEALIVNDKRAEELVALDDALGALATLDPRKSRIIELRFFGGLSIAETAEVLKLAPITVTREWRSAKAWLRREMNKT